ncbi:hypothetical protein [Bacillus sp. JCM 19034]|uniref:hypothetical protein n=1 Tax=Bacillus sp. JCM 19034 TaxID=1481928 RepID=UPI0007820C5D|nr:hypothetical protein [Bacillus sp. JCM 19034]
MKKLLYSMLFITFICTIIACSNEDATTTEGNNDEENVVDQDHNNVDHQDSGADTSDSEDDLEDNTTDNQDGLFTVISGRDDVEIVSGPLDLYAGFIGLYSAQLRNDFAQHMGTDHLDFIAFDFSIFNTSEETVIFPTDQATLTTNTGEHLTIDSKMVNYFDESLDDEYAGNEREFGSLFFVLESSKSEEIEWVEIHIDAPTDEELNAIGEDINLRIDF